MNTKQQYTQFPNTILVLIFAFLLAMYGCAKKDSPVEPEENGVEKDGVITMQFWEVAKPPTGGLQHILIDSLYINEIENRIDIPNAIPFQLPSISSSIWFFGDFEGMPDTIAVWTDYVREDRRGVKHRETDIDILGKNQGVSYLPSYGSPYYGPVRGFVFALDTDNQNSGTGFVTLKAGTFSDTLWIDAAENTVCYNRNSAVCQFTIGNSTSDLSIQPLDEFSYCILDDGAIWLVEFKNDQKQGIFAGTSSAGQGTNPFYTRKFTAYGFAPNFESK